MASMLGAIMLCIFSILLGICLTLWLLNKATVYIGAEYTNGYINVYISSIDKKEVTFFEYETGDSYVLAREEFITQFKMKNTQNN